MAASGSPDEALLTTDVISLRGMSVYMRAIGFMIVIVFVPLRLNPLSQKLSALTPPEYTCRVIVPNLLK